MPAQPGVHQVCEPSQLPSRTYEFAEWGTAHIKWAALLLLIATFLLNLFYFCSSAFSKAHDSWEPANNVHTDKLVEDFYKKHPTAICSTSSPLTICSLSMSTPTTPLSEHITNTPAPLTLEEQLTYLDEPPHSPVDIPTNLPLPTSHTHSPTLPPLPNQPLIPIDTCPPSWAGTEPSEANVDIGMYGHDLSTPWGFTWPTTTAMGRRSICWTTHIAGHTT